MASTQTVSWLEKPIQKLDESQHANSMSRGLLWTLAIGINGMTLLPLLVPIAFLYYGFKDDNNLYLLISVVLFCLNSFMMTIFSRYFGDHIPSAIFKRRLKKAIALRDDAVVDPGDPEAVFVQIIPRKNWGILMLENASDTGFLKVDFENNMIFYEGDSERWQIPKDYIADVRMTEIAANAVGIEDQLIKGNNPIILLNVVYGKADKLLPFIHRPFSMSPFGPKKKKELAWDLIEQIEDFAELV